MRLSLLVLVAFLSAVPVSDARQAPPAPPPYSLHGHVVDASGAPVPGASVVARRTASGASASAVSDEQGNFVLTVSAGDYTLTVTAGGFEALSRPLRAAVGQSETRELVLEVAAVRETVTVSAPVSYQVPLISTATRTPTLLRDVPQSVTVVTGELMKDQLMGSIGDVVQYIPGVTAHQGENNRDQVIIRGNSSSADFFVNGVRDDSQYYRDLYNLDRIEALKGPNALIFGRGGGGGVINRVTKEAGFQPLNEVSLQAGTFGQGRITGDFGRTLSDSIASRLNLLYEHADSFRDSVDLRRYGISPVLTIAAGGRTQIKLAYEYLDDRRVADRGIPSFLGRPVDFDVSTYVGDPRQSRVAARVNLASAVVEHRRGAVTVRNQVLFGDYDRFYQNFVPGAVTEDRAQIAVSAYNNATRRRNLFNQTDVTYVLSSGSIRHTVLAGVELGRQRTANVRNTGFFNNAATSILVPYVRPAVDQAVTFRQSATDADNRVRTGVGASYAQDQLELTRHVQVVGGVRYDRFGLTFHNNRTGENLRRPDNLISPRGGVIYKPVAPVSIYQSYDVSYLPSSGDQFSSLTVVTQQVEPEKFVNNEAGVKWDVRPDLAFTSAVYRLDRTNTRATDPNDATRIVQTGSQRTNGYELGVNGRIAEGWNVAGGYAWQHAFVTSATTSARAGAQVAQVPRYTFSLWNSYQIRPGAGVGLGILRRTDTYAAIDNTVTLPGSTRVDAAAYFSLSKATRLQINAENLFNRRYYVNADNNTNISPGAPRTLKAAFLTTF